MSPAVQVKVVWSVADNAGNQATAQQLIMVAARPVDAVPPVVSVPAGFTLYAGDTLQLPQVSCCTPLCESSRCSDKQQRNPR